MKLYDVSIELSLLPLRMVFESCSFWITTITWTFSIQFGNFGWSTTQWLRVSGATVPLESCGCFSWHRVEIGCSVSSSDIWNNHVGTSWTTWGCSPCYRSGLHFRHGDCVLVCWLRLFSFSGFQPSRRVTWLPWIREVCNHAYIEPLSCYHSLNSPFTLFLGDFFRHLWSLRHYQVHLQQAILQDSVRWNYHIEFKHFRSTTFSFACAVTCSEDLPPFSRFVVCFSPL